MSKNKSRNSYSREFKLEAVKLSQQPGRTVAAVARELGVRENDLHTWRKAVADLGENAFPGRGQKPQDQVTQLKREIAQLRENIWNIWYQNIWYQNSPKLCITTP